MEANKSYKQYVYTPKVNKEDGHSSKNDDPTISSYIHTISRIPLLTEEEEIRLGKTIKYSKDTNEQKKAKDVLIQRNLRFVVQFAKKYMKYTSSMTFLDLVQEGNIGLITAANKFDVDKGYKFTTYAGYWISQRITRSIVDTDSMIRYPAHIMESYFTVEKEQKRRALHGLEKMTKEEIMKRYDLSEEMADTLKKIPKKEISLEAKVSNKKSEKDDDTTISSFLESHDRSIESQILDEDRDTLIDEILNDVLNEKERDIIIRRYGLHNHEEETREAIGKSYGLSHERIRQLENGAMNKLQNMCERQKRKLRSYAVS